ncbi:MAG: sensor domain-containing diguanylate cyclase [Anaerolineaceae bacterium]|nr:sensor domain-containing diguanylate cyclase [Anaerolineaceae bacterium]
MNQKILQIGRDRIGNNRISVLLGQCDLPDFELAHYKFEHQAKNALKNNIYSLVLIYFNKAEKAIALIRYLRENYPRVPIVLIMEATRVIAEQLLKLGVHHVIPPDSLDRLSFMQIILSAVEQKRMDNELHSRYGILQAVNFAAEVFLTHLDWDTRIHDVLARFGSATRSDKVCIYENKFQIGIGITSKLHACWSSEDAFVKTPTKPIDYEQEEIFSPRWMRMLKNGEIIFGSVSTFLSEEQLPLMRRGVQSIAIVPIFSDKVWWGFVSFEQCHFDKKWAAMELEALQTAAKILGAAISRLDAEVRLTHLATHDYLTNLPNRMLLEDRFELAIARAQRSKKKFGVIAIDLDKFKDINDAHGHPFGDKVLVEIAWRLSEAVRTSDTCARVGGDEFTVLAEGINNKKDLMRVMEKLAIAMKPEIVIGGKRVRVTASMGASIFPNHGSEMEELMKAADIALYQVKDIYSGFKIFIDEQYSLPHA